MNPNSTACTPVLSGQPRPSTLVLVCVGLRQVLPISSIRIRCRLWRHKHRSNPNIGLFSCCWLRLAEVIRLFIACIGLRFIKLAIRIYDQDVEDEGEADWTSQSHYGWERWRWQVSTNFTIHVRWGKKANLGLHPPKENSVWDESGTVVKLFTTRTILSLFI